MADNITIRRVAVKSPSGCSAVTPPPRSGLTPIGINVDSLISCNGEGGVGRHDIVIISYHDEY